MLAPLSKEDKIEQFILFGRWTERTRSVTSGIGTIITNSSTSLSVAKTSIEQRDIAIQILKDKYDIKASVVRNESGDGMDVLRIENNTPWNDVEKLKIVQHLARPESWQENPTRFNGRDRPALDLDAEGIPQEEAQLYPESIDEVEH